MKLLSRLVMVAAVLFTLTSCTDTDIASKVTGIYTCTSYAYVGDEAAEIKTSNETVTINRVDDNTVNVTLKSHKWGTAEFTNVKLTDYSYSANLSGDGSIKLPNLYNSNTADLSGTVTYKSHSIAVTIRVKDYSTRLIITFTK